MSSIHIAGDDAIARRTLKSLISSQNFQVTEAPGSELPSAADVCILHGPSLASETEILEAAARFAEIAPTAVIVSTPLRGGDGDPNWYLLEQTRAALRACGVDTMVRETDDPALVVTAVRSLLIRNRPTRIHVIEDDPEMASRLRDALAVLGYNVTLSATFEDARRTFQSGSIDVLIVDRDLPDGDGLDFVTELRSLGILTPAIFLTILDDHDGIKAAIRAGGNAIVGKTYGRSFEERMEAVIVQIESAMQPIDRTGTLIYGPLEISLKDKITRWRGERIEDITKRDQELLAYLSERPGLNVPLSMLMSEIWQRPYLPSSTLTAVERHGAVVARRAALKRVFKASGIPDPIVEEDGAYRFEPKVLLSLDAYEQPTA